MNKHLTPTNNPVKHNQIISKQPINPHIHMKQPLLLKISSLSSAQTQLTTNNNILNPLQNLIIIAISWKLRKAQSIMLIAIQLYLQLLLTCSIASTSQNNSINRLIFLLKLRKCPRR